MRSQIASGKSKPKRCDMPWFERVEIMYHIPLSSSASLRISNDPTETEEWTFPIVFSTTTSNINSQSYKSYTQRHL